MLEAARDVVVTLGEQLREFAPDVHADPRVNGSMMRIARDTRFSGGKRPYKEHVDLWFWVGDASSKRSPGFWFSLLPQKLYLRSGVHHFDTAQLEGYREAVVDAGSGEALRTLVEGLRNAGYELGGRHYKRVPRGWDASPERADLLLHRGLYGWIELPAAALPFGIGFPAFRAGHYKQLAPLNEWLRPLATA